MQWQPFSTVPREEDRPILIWIGWGDGRGCADVVEWHDHMGDRPWFNGDVFLPEKHITHWADLVPPSKIDQE